VYYLRRDGPGERQHKDEFALTMSFYKEKKEEAQGEMESDF
jgi:hypothetical protein